METKSKDLPWSPKKLERMWNAFCFRHLYSSLYFYFILFSYCRSVFLVVIWQLAPLIQEVTRLRLESLSFNFKIKLGSKLGPAWIRWQPLGQLCPGVKNGWVLFGSGIPAPTLTCGIARRERLLLQTELLGGMDKILFAYHYAMKYYFLNLDK